MATKKFDLIVIGGGTGGLRLATRAGAAGLKTVLFEPGKLGGTCLNNGCIPTKAMLEAAHRFEALKELPTFGITVQKPKVDFAKLMKRVLSIPRTGQKHIKVGIPLNKKLTHVAKPAHFLDKKTVEADGIKYTAPNIVIATGAKNFVPPIPGVKDIKYLTNESVLNLRELPKSILLVGCGYISMEYATFFNTLGSKVTMFEYCDQVLGMLDRDVANTLLKEYKGKGIDIQTSTATHSFKPMANGKVKVQYHKLPDTTKKKKQPEIKSKTFDAIFMATGRVPNTKKLHLENAGVKVGPRGDIPITNTMQTNVPGIYSMGDCTGKALFAHTVKREANIILNNILNPKKKQSINFGLIPWTAFTNPNVSGIGLNEAQCQANDIEYNVARVLMKKAGRTTIINDTRGFVKVLYSPTTRKILGASIIGPHADDLIHEIVVVMNSKEPTIDVIQRSIHVHPTVSEVFSELR